MSNLFILIDEQRRANVIEFIKALNLKRTMSVEIKQYRKNRSNAQNRTYWGWLKIIGQQTGYEDEELHETLKIRFLGVEQKLVLGERFTLTKSTTKLNTQEFADYLNKVELLANELGINLPHPDDYRFALMLDKAA